MLKNKYSDYVEHYITNKNEITINFDGDGDGDGFPSFEPTEFDYSSLNPSLNPTFNPSFNPTKYFINSNNINTSSNNLDFNQIIIITFLTIGPVLLIIFLFKYKKYILSNNFYKDKKNKDLKMDQFGVEINNIYHDIESCNNENQDLID